MDHFNISLKSLNDFIEDTAVIVATAYLLGRGRLLTTVFGQGRSRRDVVKLGLILGIVAFSEVVFPEERYPYLTDTLTTGFATLAGGPPAGLVSAAVVTVGALVFRPDYWLVRAVGVLGTVAVCWLAGRAVRFKPNAAIAFAAGLASQVVAMITTHLLRPQSLEGGLDWHAFGAVLGNAAGMVMTTKVFQEAWVRVNSERNRLEAEQAKSLAAEAQLAATAAQLAALRARVHPHFLYNALTAISGLCGVAPDEAEELAAQLGDLMRRTLESSVSPTIPLHKELEYVRVYLAIEQRRYAERLRVTWDVDDACVDVAVPPFALQTLVENAVRHGVAPVSRTVNVEITIRRCGRHRVLIAVVDDGVGITASARRQRVTPEHPATHGLTLMNNQLTLLFGKYARLRLFGSPESGGTLATFAAPLDGRKGGSTP